MLNHLTLAHPHNRAALAAAALTVVVMSGCGSDDGATTQTQRASTAAAATAPATSAAPAPAAASSSAPAAEPTAVNCPVTASEVSRRVGLKLHATRPVFNAKVSCAFGPVDACPCGSAKYSEAIVVIAAGLPQTVAKQRTNFGGAKVIDRPDLGKDAFAVQGPGQRGRSAGFPTSDGTALVSVSFGLQDKASQAHAARDARVADRVITLVARRMG